MRLIDPRLLTVRRLSMAIARCLASAIVFAAMIPAAGLTQLPRDDFKDSWFWGVKGGVISFSTTTLEDRTEPVVGGEWLLTRTQGALYLALDQSLFRASSTVTDTTGAAHDVTISDMRRFTMAAFAFPLFLD